MKSYTKDDWIPLFALCFFLIQERIVNNELSKNVGVFL